MEGDAVAGTERLAAAQAALRRGDWAEAAAGFRAVLAEHEDGAAHEGLAQWAWWQDEGAVSLQAREDAYRFYRARGDDLGAARAATALAWDSVLFGQGDAVARGWAQRAQDLLDGVPEASEHGWLHVRSAELALHVDADPERAAVHALEAHDIGRRQRDADLELTGQALAGLAHVSAGRLVEGMPRLDAAVAAATAGDVSDLMWMGKICCWLIVACQETQDVERASDWCRRVEVICEARDLAPLFAVCRIQYASLQVVRGTWPDAETALTGVVGRLAGSRRGSRLEAVAQLGELRRRQGRLDEAEALLAQAEFVPEAIISRARLRLDRGDAAAARSGLDELLARLPESNRLARAAVLPSAAAAALAEGDREAAQRIAIELRATADLVGTEPLLARACAAEASLAEGRSAVALWSEAVRRFSMAGLRFDEGESRLALAESLLAVGDGAQAREQAGTAAAAFRDLSAESHLARAQALIGAQAAPASPLTSRQAEILRLVAEGLTNADIARRMHLSEHTVHRHISNILAALGLRSRAAAAAYAAGAGLLDTEDRHDRR